MVSLSIILMFFICFVSFLIVKIKLLLLVYLVIKTVCILGALGSCSLQQNWKWLVSVKGIYLDLLNRIGFVVQ